MQRKPTKNTRGPNAEEKAFAGWVKEHHCICCGRQGPSIVDHAMGATFKKNKVLIGHWWLLPLCEFCDQVKTFGSRKVFMEKFGLMSRLWLKLIKNYDSDIPDEVVDSIKAMEGENK